MGEQNMVKIQEQFRKNIHPLSDYSVAISYFPFQLKPLAFELPALSYSFFI
jgi:hypothetical protein